jgi:hypothetical protein
MSIKKNKLGLQDSERKRTPFQGGLDNKFFRGADSSGAPSRGAGETSEEAIEVSVKDKHEPVDRCA